MATYSGSDMKGELRAYQKLCRLFPKAHFIRIESWTGVGFFDVNGCLNGVEAWAECKQVNKPKRPETLIKSYKIRPAQIAWESLRRRAGGRTFVALMIGDDFCLLPGKFLVNLRDGMSQEDVRRFTLPNETLFDRLYL